MADETAGRAPRSSTGATYRFRPVAEVLKQRPQMLPAGGPALGGWTSPIDDLASRSRAVGADVRRAAVRVVRESLTCALAIVWVTLLGCAHTLGWGRPRRLLYAAAVFAVPWCFLALPPGGVMLATWGEFVAAGQWALAARVTGTLLGGSLVLFHFVMALVQVPQAHQEVGTMRLEDRLVQVERLLRMPVDSAEQFGAWLERTRAWTAAVESELRASHSPEAAYAFRRVAPGVPVRHAHRYDAVHDGWLNLLAWRRDLLADLVDPRARRSATRAVTEFRQAI